MCSPRTRDEPPPRRTKPEGRRVPAHAGMNRLPGPFNRTPRVRHAGMNRVSVSLVGEAIPGVPRTRDEPVYIPLVRRLLCSRARGDEPISHALKCQSTSVPRARGMNRLHDAGPRRAVAVPRARGDEMGGRWFPRFEIVFPATRG